MKKTLNTDEIAETLRRDEYAGWSYAGAWALAEYLKDIEDGTGDEMEFDPVEIRCDFAEWSDLEDFAADYYGQDKHALNVAIGADGSEDEDERADLIRDWINDNGTLIEFEGGVIVSSF